MTIQIELSDGTFADLDTANIIAINDFSGACRIETGDGKFLDTKASYEDIKKLLGEYIDIK
ncbi:hypothetical protein EGY05_13785 [Chryseobacterium arthrosphaerae]|uniref:Uncharacterized protein n=1 Tax=Chryseobacterium arthrosphaerae TaxID=651561 RepID=A0A1B8ZSC9_9FLAO|nr:hypothetical protein [Chryseobacterium arthrosphaerae]AYZ12933.1 hypothetical protein EGY05_13785 [Chryseobacterium arthrosphaerae]OCA74500.1 hypothetical protein BBI00_09240 [Chryseobacterium arthrosphaerae]